MFSDDYYKAFSGWCEKMYGWTFPKEELAFSPGIIPAMYQHTAEYNGIEYVCSPLKIDNGNYFTIDFEDFGDAPQSL